jgi:NAD(P)-dependent dehydrogenase (short-subunit alcohol dehydrogenase family)
MGEVRVKDRVKVRVGNPGKGNEGKEFDFELSPDKLRLHHAPRHRMNIVITGSSTGIGRALAERLLGQGHQVWGLARSDQAGLVTNAHGGFHATPCDVSIWPEVEAAARAIAAAWPAIDGLVTCAGIQGGAGRTLATDPTRWGATVRTNLDGTYHALRALAPLLERAARRAKVVCFSGGGATKPRPNFSAYGAAKTGVVRLVETIAEEEHGRPLDINAVAPGAINTRMTDEVIALGPAIAGEAEYQAALKQKETGGASLGQALDLVEWLLSPASDGITGRLISAQWDPWEQLARHQAALAASDTYTLRRITPKDRRQNFTP